MNVSRGFHSIIDWKVVNLICKKYNFIWKIVIWKIVNFIWNMVDLRRTCYITQDRLDRFSWSSICWIFSFILLYILFGTTFSWYLRDVFSPNIFLKFISEKWFQRGLMKCISWKSMSFHCARIGNPIDSFGLHVWFVRRIRP